MGDTCPVQGISLDSVILVGGKHGKRIQASHEAARPFVLEELFRATEGMFNPANCLGLFAQLVKKKVEAMELKVNADGCFEFPCRSLKVFEADMEAKTPKEIGAPAEHVTRFLEIAMNLKREKRTGWVLRDVKSAESVSDHSFGVAFDALLIADEEIDKGRAVQMALVHDLAEALVGDIAPGQGVSEADKHEKETAAMDSLLAILGKNSAQAATIRDLWKEYEKRESKEAMLIKDLDRFDMILTASIYEKNGQSSPGALKEFFEGVRGKITHPEVQKWQSRIDP